MADELRPLNWWQTIPGILTATAAVITAVTGLILALNQTGILDFRGRPDPAAASAPKPAASSGPSAARSANGEAPNPSGGARATAYDVVPVQKEARFNHSFYTILSAQAEPVDADKLRLRFEVRMTVTHGYAANFWSSSFRLRVDGVPRAPANVLNEVVENNSAKEGTVEFVVPTKAASLELLMYSGNSSDEPVRIPLELRPAKS